MRKRTISCPRCGVKLQLEPHPTVKGRVVAKCNCIGRVVRVYDAPVPLPPVEEPEEVKNGSN